MSSRRFTWSRPTTHIYSYNREAQDILSSRCSRATSVSATACESATRTARAASVANADAFQGYSGFYSRSLALINQKRGPTAAAAAVPVSASLRAGSPAPTIYPVRAAVASAASTSTSASLASYAQSSSVQEQTTSTVRKSEFNAAREQKESLEYGRKSVSSALRRAEQHAVSSGKDPRHTVLPRSLGDDICKVVADLHSSPYESKELTSAKASYLQGRVKVERMEKELGRVTEAAMSYKSAWSKSASAMAREALEACEMEAASSKKVRRTVVEESSRRQVAAA